MKPLSARVMQDRSLQEEELDRYQHQESKRHSHLPDRRFADRDKTIERREQQRVKYGEDGESAWARRQRSDRIEKCSDRSHDHTLPDAAASASS